MDAAHGPVPGAHHVEVNILSRDSSNMKSGNYSMDDAESYTKVRPGAKGPLMAEIAADQEIQISIVTR